MSIPPSSQRKQVPVGKYFLETGQLSAEDLDRALTYKQETNCKLGQALVALGLVLEEDLLKALQAQGKFHCLKLTPGIVDHKIAGDLEESDARRLRSLPINRIADYTTVVMEDPTDVYAIDELAVLLKSKVLAVFAEPTRIREVMDEVYNSGGAMGGLSLGSSISFSSSNTPAPTVPVNPFSPIDGLGSTDYDPTPAGYPEEEYSTSASYDPQANVAADPYPTFTEEGGVFSEGLGDLGDASSGVYGEPAHDSPTDEHASYGATILPGSAAAWAPSPSPESTKAQEGDVDEHAEDSVRRILAQAITERASDVHLEPRRGDLLVRFRIDGALQERATAPRSWADALIRRIKEMADLDTAQQGLPQEGRAQLAFKSQRVDLRVSTTPTIHGEGAVLRLLDGGELRALEDFDFSPEQHDALANAIQCRHGLVLATGPNGSGKTTTLYSILQRFISNDTKIVTLEDPVEHVVEGVTQINVDPRHGFGFAAGLRSILHQDPDIVLLGKIPDADTARSVVQAATFGQLVLSNMHALGAPEAVGRLVDRGVERYLLADTLRVVVAQRLLRRICTACRKAHTPDPRTVAYLGLEPTDNVFHFGTGCDACHGTGYHGRIGIYEIMPITPALRILIAKGASTEELSECARSEGMTHLRSDGLEKARAGLTTLQEVLAATSHG